MTGNMKRTAGYVYRRLSVANIPGVGRAAYTTPASESKSVGGKLLLTEKEAAERLNISPSALFRLRKSGRIGYVQTGRAGVRYTPDQLTAWIASARKDAK